MRLAELLSHYDLFLFDFDGLLVDTEQIHYRAYRACCAEKGLIFPWDWPAYARLALYSAEGLRQALYAHFPHLNTLFSSWEVFYQEKKRIYQRLVEEEPVVLMPGVAALLDALAKQAVKRCVVTHSSREQVEALKAKSPLLQTIPFWVTREEYTLPKPAADSYQKACALYAEPKEKIVGFEDSPRGLQALLGSRADGILVTSILSPAEVEALYPVMPRPFQYLKTLATCF